MSSHTKPPSEVFVSEPWAKQTKPNIFTSLKQATRSVRWRKFNSEQIFLNCFTCLFTFYSNSSFFQKNYRLDCYTNELCFFIPIFLTFTPVPANSECRYLQDIYNYNRSHLFKFIIMSKTIFFCQVWNKSIVN